MFVRTYSVNTDEEDMLWHTMARKIACQVNMKPTTLQLLFLALDVKEAVLNYVISSVSAAATIV